MAIDNSTYPYRALDNHPTYRLGEKREEEEKREKRGREKREKRRMKDFIQRLHLTGRFVNKDAARIIGTIAVKHTEQAFEDEGFSDKLPKDNKWKDVQRRLNPRNYHTPADRKRKILRGRTRRGGMGDATYYKAMGRAVRIINPKIYSSVHNYGENAGRGAGFKMTKRQFIGPSFVLTQTANKALVTKMKNYWI